MFNAAKERALDHFIAGRIGFCDMNVIVEEVLNRQSPGESHKDAGITLDRVLRADHLARICADDVMREQASRK